MGKKIKEPKTLRNMLVSKAKSAETITPAAPDAILPPFEAASIFTIPLDVESVEFADPNNIFSFFSPEQFPPQSDEIMGRFEVSYTRPSELMSSDEMLEEFNRHGIKLD